jgi:hypothetical protein
MAGSERNAIPSRAPVAANKLRAEVEALRIGHAVLNREQFLAELESGSFEVWALPAGAYALITWGETEHGKTCNILTVTGDSEAAAESGLLAIERMTREAGGRVVVSVGRPGWAPLMRKHGYTVIPKILMSKVLES